MKPSRGNLQLITDAAARLVCIDDADPDMVPAAVRLHCLRALDLLQCVGADLGDPEPADRYEISELLRQALHDLSQLAPGVFTIDEVVEATAATRYALQLCTPGLDGER